jgi:hypothetical protein
VAAFRIGAHYQTRAGGRHAPAALRAEAYSDAQGDGE